METVDALIAQMREADDDEMEALKAELIAYARAHRTSEVREHVETALKQELLEVQWALEEVVEVLAPPKKAAATAPPPAPPPEDASGRPLRPSEIELVYSDPRGIRLYKSKIDDRWIVSQIDPRIGQPVTYELPGSEGARIKQQLAGSPYWLKDV